jgi:Tfp pilus assembly protein PilX
VNVRHPLVAMLRDDVMDAYDAAESALRAAERDAPEVADPIRAAVASLFAARVALDEGKS